MTTQHSMGRRIRRITAVAVSTTFLAQNFAWAVCSDGQGITPGTGGYQFINLPVSLQNMSPNMFTGTAGSAFLPDNSTFENNDPVNGTTTTAPNGPGITGLPATALGGHSYEFDQGSTTCKAVDTGLAGQPATGWSIPPNTTTDCFVLPVVKGGLFTNFGDIPYQSQYIVPTCNPNNLSGVLVNGVLTPQPNPANTRLNQLGCSISQLFTGAFTANDATNAPGYLFVAGIQGGLFAEELENTPNTSTGDSGRVTASLRYYSDIPEGSKLTNAIVSPDGHFAVVTSIRRNPNVFACNMPLGDPGRIDFPPPDIGTFANSFDSSSSNPNGVKCLSSVANTGLQVTLTSNFGPDNQPYMGGQRTITTMNANPGSFFVTTAWPQCIVNGKGIAITLPAQYPNYAAVAQLDAAINTVFHNHSNGGCGTMFPNSGFSASTVIQPGAMTSYTAFNGNKYMFTAGTGQPVVQARVGQNADGTSNYHIRTYLSGGTGFVTGVGIAPDMSFIGTNAVNTIGQTPAVGATGSGSLIVMQDPTGLNLASQEVMTRLPLCEDF